MNAVLYALLPAILSTSGSFTSILADATEVLQWFITGMGSLITFILANPLILMMFMILLSGSVIAMFLRLWKSA